MTDSSAPFSICLPLRPPFLVVDDDDDMVASFGKALCTLSVLTMALSVLSCLFWDGDDWAKRRWGHQSRWYQTTVMVGHKCWQSTKCRKNRKIRWLRSTVLIALGPAKTHINKKKADHQSLRYDINIYALSGFATDCISSSSRLVSLQLSDVVVTAFPSPPPPLSPPLPTCVVAWSC